MKHRLRFAAGKLLRMALLMLGVSILTFALMTASPLDPLQTNVGQVALGSMSAEQVAKLEAYWGVGTPPVERYLGWLGPRCFPASRCWKWWASGWQGPCGCCCLPGSSRVCWALCWA